MFEKLQHALQLDSHVVRPNDLAKLFERALDSHVAVLEKERKAQTSRPQRQPRQRGSDSRHVPAHVKREVWKRDDGKCAFVSDSGHLCESRERLELDHVVPYAKGGPSTVANLRIRCRAHNQLAADREFGRRQMEGQRAVARGSRIDMNEHERALRP